MELRPEEISRIIRSQIKHYEAKINQSETGTVTLIGDGIARAAGLDGCMAGELLEFPGGVYGMAQNLEESSVSIVMLGSEEGIREGLREYLELEGYTVGAAASAEQALKMDPSSYDLLLLDIMMDGMGGLEMLRRLRADTSTARLAVILLTALDAEADMVAGLRLGADDYIAKPFSMRNVLARIEAVLRRSSPTPAEPEPAGVACDRATLTVRVDGREVRMPRKEFEILALLLDHPGRIFSREELMARIWPENVVVVERSVDVHIARIRAKIAPYGKHIISRSGYGYGWQD